MPTFHFNRRAWNESWSGRTAKVGKPKEGLAAALAAAIQHADKEGAEINVLNDCNVCVAKVSSRYVQMSRSMLAELLAAHPALLTDPPKRRGHTPNATRSLPSGKDRLNEHQQSCPKPR